jgi:hypothetical protein
METETKQTAVDWLLDQLLKDGYIKRLPVLQFQQAKEMEKQQIKDALRFPITLLDMSSEEYYNETFKNK